MILDGLDGNSNLYPSENLRLVINECLCRLNLLVGINTNTVSAGSTTPGTYLYSTPVGVTIPLRVYCNGRELNKLSLRELGEKHKRWMSEATDYYGPVARWAPIGLTQFLIHPADAFGGSEIEVEGVLPMTLLLEPDDPVSLEDQWVSLLVDYGRSRAMIKEGGSAFAQSSLAYQRMISAVKDYALFEGMRFPQYFLIQELAPADGKGS